MKCSLHRIGFSISACLLSAALVDAQVPQQAQSQQQQYQQQQLQALQAERDGQQPRDVIAKVNGDPITETELKMALQTQLEGMKAQLQGQEVDRATVEKLRQQTFERLIESRLVEQYVLEEGPDVQEQEVEKIIKGAQEQLRSQGMTFDQFLAARGHTPESFEQRIKGSLAWEKYQQREISEDKLRQHFEENKEQFPVPDYEQARPWVAQSYASELWSAIVRDTRDDAEIEMEQPRGAARPGTPQAAERVQPGSTR